MIIYNIKIDFYKNYMYISNQFKEYKTYKFKNGYTQYNII